MLTRKVCIFVCECFSCERGNWKPSVRLNDHMPISHVDGWYQARVVAVRLKHITTKCIPSHIIGHWNMLTENANRVLVFVSVNLQMCLCWYLYISLTDESKLGYMVIFFFLFHFCFSVRILSVLCGHSFFLSPPQRSMTSDFEGWIYGYESLKQACGRDGGRYNISMSIIDDTFSTRTVCVYLVSSNDLYITSLLSNMFSITKYRFL